MSDSLLRAVVSMQDFKHVVQPKKETSWIANRKKNWFPAAFRISYSWNLVGGAASKGPFSLRVLAAPWETHGWRCYRKAKFSLFTCVAQTAHRHFLFASWMVPDVGCGWDKQNVTGTASQDSTPLVNNFSFYNVASHTFHFLLLDPKALIALIKFCSATEWIWGPEA